QAEAGTAEDGQDEGGASAKSRRRSFSCCARRRSQEAASVQELGFRLQGVAERLNALNRGKAAVEVAATTLGQQLQQSQEECTAAKGQLQQMKDTFEASEEAKAGVEAQLQKAKETEAAL
ncbi:unnamed protein product, partial [Effrenium voratum]